MKILTNTVLLVAIPCISEMTRRFRLTNHLNIQSQKVSQARKPRKRRKLSWFLADIIVVCMSDYRLGLDW
jgi:hypothetical protein